MDIRSAAVEPRRRLALFEKLNDGAEKTMLTLDRILPDQPRADVRIVNAVDWLLARPGA